MAKQTMSLKMPTDSEMLKEIWSKMPVLDTLLDKIEKISGRIDKLEGRVSAAEQQNIDLDNGLSYMENQLTELTSSMETKVTCSVTDKLHTQIVDLANRERRNNIVLHNVPEKSEGETADCSDFVCQFVAESLGISHLEIERAHRTPMGRPGNTRNHGQGDKPRPIHVRFLKFRDREAVLRAASSKGKALKINDKRIYVSDDVHPSTRKEHKILIKKVYELRDAGHFAFVPWSIPRVIKWKEGGRDGRGPLKTLRLADLPGDKRE